MMKRILSLCLSLLLILSLLPAAVFAQTDDSIYIEDGSSLSELINSGVVKGEKPQLQSPSNVVLPDAPSKAPSPEKEDVPAEKVLCDCGAGDALLRNHVEECALKQYYMDFCDRSKVWEIYDAWFTLSEDVREFITKYLETYYPDKVVSPEEIEIIDDLTDEQIENGLTGHASATVDGTTVNASGLPEGSSLTVQEPSKEALEVIKDSMDILSKNPEQVFLYDISVQNDESSDWQPEGSSVNMKLSFSNLDLPQYTLVQILHVDDEGNLSTIEGEVDANGNIVFETNGFSTFGGFTVDFEYGSAYYSLRGLLDIYLSELFLNLHMPLQVKDVENVTFTDETLVSVEKLPEDWLLTSLEAFDTQEQLTITMKNGNEYVINVTDARQDGSHPPDIIVGGGGFDSNYENDLPNADINDNNGVEWFADGDGNLGTQPNHGDTYDDEYWEGTNNDGWSRTSTVYVGGAGKFEIVIQVWVYNTQPGNATDRYVQIQQIRILNNANVELRLGASWDNYPKLTKCYMVPNSTINSSTSNAANMFIVEGGASLTLKGRAKTSSKEACYLVLDGNGKLVDRVDNQLVRLEAGAKNFTASYVQFANAPRSAIKARPTNMTSFSMSNCIFDSDVRRVSDTNTGSGGAIYLEAMSGSSYTWIGNFTLSNCQFNGCYSAESGGALGLYGKIATATITGCTFTDTKATKGGGGAIQMAGHSGSFTLSGCTFTRCNAVNDYGGAVHFLSYILDDRKDGSGNYTGNLTQSRTNEIYVTNCTFTSTEGKLGGAMAFRSQTEKIEISGCTITNTKANEGGAFAIGYTNLNHNAKGQTTPNFISNDGFTTTQNGHKYAWPVVDSTTGEESTQYRTTFGSVSITNTDVTGASGDYQGGAITVMTNSCLDSLTMSDFNITNCTSIRAGSAIHMGGCIVGSLSYSDSKVEGCKTTLNNADEVGGTFRTIGSTTCNASITNVTFKDNSSHCSGGGVYWNASGVRPTRTGASVDTEVAISNCMFDGNHAGWYGGGIYCESRMTVESCEFKNNIADLIGGGIGFQLYNNNTRMFGDNETTSLTLDANTKIHHNMAPVGGGVSVRANASMAIDNATAYKHTLAFQLGGAQIYNNVATQDGGGVWFNVETYLSEDSDPSNQQEVERITKRITLDVGSVYDNTAAQHGGGIYMNAGVITDPENTATNTLSSNGTCTINVTGAEIYGNEAGFSRTTQTTTVNGVTTYVKDASGNLSFTAGTVSGGNGGGIYLTGDKSVCYVNGGDIGRNVTATVEMVESKDENGDVILDANGDPVMEETTVYSYTKAPNKAHALNQTNGNGGGIAIYNGSRIEMTGGNVMYNEAYVGGGIAVRAGSTMTSGKDDDGNSGTVSYNKATSAGGGIAVHDDSAMYINEGTVSYNEAGYGGGISIMSSTGSEAYDIDYGFVFDGGRVENNWSTTLGGGIVLSDSSTAYLNGGEIGTNFASTNKEGTTFASGQEGGGIAVCQGSYMLIEGGKISGNKAYNGGGICIRGGSSVTMSGSVTVGEDNVVSASSGSVETNTAKYWGGGIYIAAAALNTETNEYMANSMKMTGGWIYDNDATSQNGGGVYVGSNNYFELTGGRVESNYTKTWGGGVYVSGATVLINGGEILENDAVVGAAICIENSGDVTVQDGKIYSNRATSHAGAIYCYVSSLTVSGGELYKNYAYDRGTIYGYGATINLSGGQIYENECFHGGGVFLYECSTEITGGKIYSNVDCREGGGIFIRKGSATIEGGEVYSNKASIKGGGYIIDSGAVVDITGGVIRDNEAPDGGGIWIKNHAASEAECTTVRIYGGTISGNKSSLNGAGIWIDGNGYYDDSDANAIKCTSVALYGGSVTGNISEFAGGGIYAVNKGVVIVTSNTKDGVTTAGSITGNTAYYGGGIHADGNGTIVSIEGGSVSGNFARDNENQELIGYHGGGIYADNFAVVTMIGGDLKNNVANGDGGGVFADNSADVTLKGGDVTNNTAKGNGGGIYADHSAKVLVTKNVATAAEEGTTTFGNISYNSAYNGGGVFVTRGAQLEVNEGHITYNTAAVPAGVELTDTGHHEFEDLYGAGGGIAVANPSGTTTYSQFKLTGNNIAIYGNLADFAADDVFANGLYTRLDVPQVAQMTLDGYGFKPEGWFEDYAVDDEYYFSSDALNMAPTGSSVERYRKAMPADRWHILPLYVTGEYGGQNIKATDDAYVMKDNTYVCMTLGIPSAVDDTVVLDYGLNVNINVQANDLSLNVQDFTNTGKLGLSLPAGMVPVENVYFNTTLDTSIFSGKTLAQKVDGGAGLNYGSATMTDNFVLYAMNTGSVMTGLDTFYYAVLHNSYYYYAKVTVIPATSIYYEDNSDFVTFSEPSSDGKIVGWTNTDTTVSLDNVVQDCDRPGSSTIVGIDADSVYGYDSHYKNMATYSMGSAHKAVIGTNSAATATFTFTGTGFDVISLTGNTTGMIMVSIYNGTEASGTPVDILMVDTYYSTSDPLYQVPVIKKDLGTYGIYTVEIYVAYSFWADHGQVVDGGEWEFYLDAIRVYDPANGGNSDSTGAIKDAYSKDKEGSPIYQELRNMILSANSFITGSNADVNGMVYIDGKSSSIANYHDYGPNNEIYLNAGDAIAFAVNELNFADKTLSAFGTNLTSVQLGIKSVSVGSGKSGSVKIFNTNSTAAATEATEVNTATEMYYDITGFENQIVVIYNSGSTILSITNLKATFDELVVIEDAVPLADLVTISDEGAKQAINAINAAGSIKATDASLSFKDQVYYNIYFNVDGYGVVDTADMGLITFNSNIDGTIENADAVISGVEAVNGGYRVQSNGVAAKNLVDTLYFKVYIRLADGSYIYSNLYHYSARAYAESVLAKSDSESMKALVVSMLNYGAEAQKFFGYKTDDLANKDLTAEQQALVADANIAKTEKYTVGAKAGAFANNGGFSGCNPSVSFESTFAINFYFQPAYEVQSPVTFYYWNLADYNAASVLTAENATGSSVITLGSNGAYKAVCGDIAAKNMDDEIFVVAVYESGGVTYSSGIRHYSVGTYCRNFAANEGSAMQDFAKAALVYGSYAKNHFGNV